MVKGDRRATFGERSGGNLIIPNRLPATQLGMLSNSGGRARFNAGATGLRPTKHQSGAERRFAGSHGSHVQSSDACKEGLDAIKGASGLLSKVGANCRLSDFTIGQRPRMLFPGVYRSLVGLAAPAVRPAAELTSDAVNLNDSSRSRKRAKSQGR